MMGSEPRTFQGERYDQNAILGGLLLYLCLKIGIYYEHLLWVVAISILLRLLAVYAARM